jgi:hypothetical protein
MFLHTLKERGPLLISLAAFVLSGLTFYSNSRIKHDLRAYLLEMPEGRTIEKLPVALAFINHGNRNAAILKASLTFRFPDSSGVLYDGESQPSLPVIVEPGHITTLTITSDYLVTERSRSDEGESHGAADRLANKTFDVRIHILAMNANGEQFATEFPLFELKIESDRSLRMRPDEETEDRALFLFSDEVHRVQRLAPLPRGRRLLLPDTKSP